ncbi:MAG: hypothetical protein GVY26_10665 [Bacteroidetes bacterium]|nr:hypothetical protein [Bacteroidota bacterium]
MNAENFSQYLRDPSLLHQVSYEELKTVSLQYPYCQPLRLLLLKKCLLDNRGNWREALAQVASRSVDRRLLFERVRALGGTTEAVDNFLMAEEYLELKSLEELEEEALPLSGAADEGVQFDFDPADANATERPAPTAQAPHAQDEDGLFSTEEEQKYAPHRAMQLQDWTSQQLQQIAGALQGTAQPAHPAVSSPQDEHLDGEWVHQLLPKAVLTAIAIDFVADKARSPVQARPASTSRMAPHTPLHEGIPRPRPKTSFTSWIAQFQPPNIQNQLSDIMESKHLEDLKKNKKKRKTGQKDVSHIAEQSITRHPDVISETLAKLLAQQGEKEQAAEIYERLMLVFPEKSAYFAHRIEQLKKNSL